MRQLECVDLVERVTDYLEDSIDGGIRKQLVEHLEECWACEHYIGEIAVAVRLMADLPPERPSAELESNLVGMYREWAAEVVA